MTVCEVLACGIAAASIQLAASGDPISFHDPEFSAQGIEVDLIRLSGREPDTLAVQLVEAEGLTSWNGEMTGIGAPSGLYLKAMTAGDGRNVAVVYRNGRDAVCRVRARTTAATDARWRASRWCAAQMGVELPDRGPPIIVPGS
jgi:hypothetical protein